MGTRSQLRQKLAEEVRITSHPSPALPSAQIVKERINVEYVEIPPDLRTHDDVLRPHLEALSEAPTLEALQAAHQAAVLIGVLHDDEDGLLEDQVTAELPGTRAEGLLALGGVHAIQPDPYRLPVP